LTVLLIPKETGDLLLEVSATGIEAVPPMALPAATQEPAESLSTERRLSSRVSVAIPAHIDNFETPSPLRQQIGTTVNLSIGGACLRLHEQRDLVGHRLLLRLSPPSIPGAQIGGTQSPSQECTVTGQVVWAGPDPTARTGSDNVNALPAICAGIRFLPLNDEAQQRIASLIGRFLTSPSRLEEWAGTSKVVSELRDCRNQKGQRIAMYHDRRRDGLPPGSPLVIICPGYGETKKDYIALAYHLASNGFQVLRFDYTNHVGESDGVITDTTLTGMKQDLKVVLDYSERMWPASPIAVAAASLGARVALKALAHERRVRLLILLTPVVDIQATLFAVHQEDYLGTYMQGVRRGLVNMLGFNISSEAWLEDATKGGYADLQTTIADSRKLATRVILFTAEQDVWVKQESIRQVQCALGPNLGHLYLIPEALHRLQENPRKARSVFRQLVSCCLEELYPLALPSELQDPSQREIGLQNRLERERARAQRSMAKAESIEFWREYLDHFHYIANVADYWHLLDHVYRLMGTCERGELILDAGCGNGNFGMFLTINQTYRSRHSHRSDSKPPFYMGLDFIADALRQAQHNMQAVAMHSRNPLKESSTSDAPLKATFLRADLDLVLPFKDNQFDRVVCNLVVGYLQDPLFTLRELIRILSPHGRLVLTNLKPHADLTQIYRNFVQVTHQPAELEEARRLLNNSGKIKQGETDGTFRFFDKQELTTLLSSAGAVRPRVYTTFANQAYVAVAEKPGKMHGQETLTF
jgi:alpha-beta hydrolase superfamily lysophospholipase/SAM-dependent methyltransferase